MGFKYMPDRRIWLTHQPSQSRARKRDDDAGSLEEGSLKIPSLAPYLTLPYLCLHNSTTGDLLRFLCLIRVCGLERARECGSVCVVELTN